MSVKTERRTQSRKRPLSLVYVELPPSNGGMMRELSERGFSLRVMMPLQPSEKVPFLFSLDNGVRVDGEAIVVRVGDGGHVAALEFAGLAPHSRDHIRRWLQKVDEPIAREAGPANPSPASESTFAELREQARSVIARPPTAPKLAAAGPPPAKEDPVSPTLFTEEAPASAQASRQTPATPLPIVSEPLPESPGELSEFAPPWLTSPSTPRVAPEPVAPHLNLPTSMASLPIEQAEQRALPIPPISSPPHQEPLEPPPLLRLSSVRPTPAPETLPNHIAVPATPTKPPVEVPATPGLAQVSPAPIQSAPMPAPIQDLLIPPPSVAATEAPAHAIPAATSVATRSNRSQPPALEPLYSLEEETETGAPGWMERFTLVRAVGVMFVLTLMAASLVFHRELGHALIWLGQEIAGDESSQTSRLVRPQVAPPPAPVKSEALPAADSTKPANAANPPPVPARPEPPSASVVSKNKSAELPSTTQNPTTAQLKDSASNTLVPLTETHRELTAPAASFSESGREEYQKAEKILRTPSRKAEVPDAVALLWYAVSKGNVSAEITLAELYHRGRGVTRSCGQTKILLSAAAAKGSRDAKTRLKQLQGEGCQD